MSEIMPELCRAARGFLDWNQDDLAEKAGVSKSCVRGFESGRSMPVPQNLAAIQAALERAGLVFLAADENGGPGLRQVKVKRRRR